VHRDSLFCIQYFTESAGAWLRQTHSAMRPYVSGQAYQNYIDRELNDWRRAYYGANYRRLVEVRKRVDPEHRFNFPQAIGR
jgi:FAD/FMN-containing dehydrogenase